MTNKTEKLHILYIHQYFTTPHGTSGCRSYEFARRWVKQGHQVSLLTSTGNLSKADMDRACGRFIKRFNVDGIEVYAFNIAYRQQMGYLKRCAAFFAFMFLSALAMPFFKHADIIYATSTPLTVGLPGLVGKLLNRQKFVFEVRDQWPESVIQIGAIRNKFLIRLLCCFEKKIYRHADAIVALSEPMAESIRKVAPPGKKLYSVPNSCDLDLFNPRVDGTPVREKHNWNGKIVFMHAGSIGRINNLEFVVAAAEKLQNRDDIHFVLIGRGNQKPHLENRIKQSGLSNITVLPPVAKKQLSEYLAAADVIIPIIGNYRIIEQHASLNKFFDGLSAGKAMLLNYSGWQRKLIEENQAGLGCELCNLDQFVEKVETVCADPSKRQLMGKNARRLAETRFDRGLLAQKALNILNEVYKKS